MTGKEKCSVLRTLRMRAAELNEIDYPFEECTHEGPCEGVCAFCDNELRELEALIEERRAEGLPVYMEYMFPVPAPELPVHRETFAARLKRILTRARLQRPEPEEALIMGRLSDEQADQWRRRQDEEDYRRALECFSKAEILTGPRKNEPELMVTMGVISPREYERTHPSPPEMRDMQLREPSCAEEDAQ